MKLFSRTDRPEALAYAEVDGVIVEEEPDDLPIEITSKECSGKCRHCHPPCWQEVELDGIPQRTGEK